MEKKPKYRQLQDELTKRVHTQYNPGDKFLTQREIMKEYEVCLDSVDRALRSMVEEGLLTRRHGSGTYVREFTNPTGHGGRIALIMQRNVGWGIRDFYSELLYEINDRLTLGNLSYNYWFLDEKNPPSALLRRLTVEGGFDGALYIGPTGDELIDQLVERHFPLVVIDRHYDTPRTVFVVGDNEDGARQAVQYLHARHHRKIGLVSSAFHTTFLERYEGYINALYELGIKPERAWQARHFREETALADLTPIFAGADRPTALFVMNDSTAHVVVHTLERMGIRVPQEVSIVGFDDDFFATHTVPNLTTVAAPRRQMGAEAVDLLRRMLAGETVASRILPVRLIERDSVAEAPR